MSVNPSPLHLTLLNGQISHPKYRSEMSTPHDDAAAGLFLSESQHFTGGVSYDLFLNCLSVTFSLLTVTEEGAFLTDRHASIPTTSNSGILWVPNECRRQ